MVLAYCMGGYFYEIESALTQRPAMQEICQAGDGKGKITKLYLLRGLAKLAAWEEIQSSIDQNERSSDEVN